MNLKNKIKSDEIFSSCIDILQSEKAFLVGGYIRDCFLGLESLDRDLVVEGNRAEILADKIIEKLGGTKILLDEELSTYRVMLKDKENFFDITQTNSILEDARRRDFKLNSIYYNFITSEIFDPLNGLSALSNKKLSTYSLDNLKDDPLRILRAFRFASCFDLDIDNEILEFAKLSAHLLKNPAPERIKAELIKMFAGKNLVKALKLAVDYDVIEVIFPIIKRIKEIPPNSHHHLPLIEHLIETVNNLNSACPYLRLASFLHDAGKPDTWKIEENGRHRFIGHDTLGAEIIKSDLKRLKFSNSEIAHITSCIKYHIYPSALMQDSTVTNSAMLRFHNKTAPYSYDIIELARADRLSAKGPAITADSIEQNHNALSKLEEFCKQIDEQVALVPPFVNGEDIMTILDIPQGKIVGEILKELREKQLLGEIKSKDEAIDLARKICSSHG
ncbi:CCA tRNA nucleotidyltransferase [bacterium]|nr:CCA tRNA nucleotidyltransferase [bacterium]